jgi:transcription antitermination protein NusB
MGSRRKAREYALQMLFQWDITHDTIEQIKATFWDSQDELEETRAFAEVLASGTISSVEKIDRLIGRHAENWRLDRMAVVDRNILRLATYEFLYDAETPKTVVINEAIEIARRFSSQESPQFINGILDSIRKEVESQGAQ